MHFKKNEIENPCCSPTKGPNDTKRGCLHIVLTYFTLAVLEEKPLNVNKLESTI